MPPAATQLPQNQRAQDTNGNGRIERAEAQAQVAASFDFYDADGDGAVSGAEATRGPLKLVAPPDLTYSTQVNIVLGGKRVEVIPIPTDHAPDNTVVRFVDGSNVVFASDWITNARVPFGPNVTMPSELAKIRQVQALDFEHFICSHGRLGTKADVSANLRVSRSGRRRGARSDRRRQDARANTRHRPDERVRELGVLRAAAAAERRRRLSLVDGEPLRRGMRVVSAGREPRSSGARCAGATAPARQRSAPAAPSPDLAETWARRGCTGGQPCPFIPTELPLKARAIGFIQAFDEALGPKYDCAPATMPSLVIDPYNFAIEQQRDRLVFTYEKDDIVRTIWLNGAGPKPSVYDSYWQGHSVGRYEDGALIVETTKFPFDPTGLDDMYNIPSSTQKRVVERYWRDGTR